MTSLRPILLLAAAVAFGVGVSLPLIRLEKLYFFTETPSLIDVVYGLWSGGDTGLAAVVAAFSLAFPIVKMATVFQATFAVSGSSGGQGHYPAWAGWVAKWSMMDVLLVALIVFAAKTSGFASAVSQPGIWFYAMSAILSALASSGLELEARPKKAKRAGGGA